MEAAAGLAAAAVGYANRRHQGFQVVVGCEGRDRRLQVVVGC